MGRFIIIIIDASTNIPSHCEFFPLSAAQTRERQSPVRLKFLPKANLLFSISVRFATAVGQMAKLQIDTGDSSHSIKMRREEDEKIIARL